MGNDVRADLLCRNRNGMTAIRWLWRIVYIRSHRVMWLAFLGVRWVRRVFVGRLCMCQGLRFRGFNARGLTSSSMGRNGTSTSIGFSVLDALEIWSKHQHSPDNCEAFSFRGIVVAFGVVKGAA